MTSCWCFVDWVCYDDDRLLAATRGYRYRLTAIGNNHNKAEVQVPFKGVSLDVETATIERRVGYRSIVLVVSLLG